MKKSGVKEFLLDIFFPRFCLGCQKEGGYLCPDCKATLDISENQYCLCDKNPLRIPTAEEKGKCQKCSGKKLAGLYFALSYKEKALTKKLIHFFKYEPFLVKDLSETLADLIIDNLKLLGKSLEAFKENSVIIPVPSDIKKIKRRGYNPSEELAKRLSEKLQLPMVLDNLAKIKQTAPQMELSKEKRFQNLKNAFTVKNSGEIAGKKIFLIDDVYTTGSTMEECATVLRRSGAKQVWGIVIARD